MLDRTQSWNEYVLFEIEHFVDAQLTAIQQEQLDDLFRLRNAETIDQQIQEEQRQQQDLWDQEQLYLMESHGTNQSLPNLLNIEPNESNISTS